MFEIGVIHGPNLNLLGKREPEVYGTASLEDINEGLKDKAKQEDIKLDILQSNHEGEIIDFIHNGIGEWSGLIINPAGLTHNSISLRDALVIARIPIIEVHLSNIFQREKFRHKSIIAPIVMGQITGLGADGYLLALTGIISIIRKEKY